MSQDPFAPLRMRWIRPGRYLRGNAEDDPAAFVYEMPRHEVLLTRGFWLSDAPVTQALWVAVMGDNPSRFEGTARPVECVSWEDAQRFCARLGQLCPNLHPRLPTEAEWDYAARACTTAPRYGELDEIAWHDGNSGERTHPVRQKQPNPWGLYDTLGNVYEWCEDRTLLGELDPPQAMLQVDPLGTEGTCRVVRGGSWLDEARLVQAALRSGASGDSTFDHLGFRIAGGRSVGSGTGNRNGRPHRGNRPPGGPEPREPR